MPKFQYCIKAEGGEGPIQIQSHIQKPWQPMEEGEGRFVRMKLEPELVDCRLTEVTAQLAVKTEPDEFIFMNGFQSWSYSPELLPKDSQMGAGSLPGPLARHYGLIQSGDYYFAPSLGKKGESQGYSYCYFRLGNQYRLIASLDEEPGYTRFTYQAAINKLTVSRDCEGLNVSGRFKAFDLFFAVGDEKTVFDGWFKALGLKSRKAPALSGYTSWYRHGEKISQEALLSDLEGAAKLLEPGDLFLIDDGWAKAPGDWMMADSEKFPAGMKAMAEAIHEKGLKAGLWLAPFVAGKGSGLYQEHPGWFYFHERKPWYGGSKWGGFYALDLDHPQVQTYLENSLELVLEDWGFDLVKLDYLFMAAPFGSGEESRGGRMIRALKFLRKCCGDKLILGCGVPLMPAFGLVDYCRIGGDASPEWKGSLAMQLAGRERRSSAQAVENAIFRRQLNGRAFGSDPDVFYLRDEDVKLKDQEKKCLALGCALFGQLRLCSDDMGAYGPAKEDAFTRLRQIGEKAKDIRVDHRPDEKGRKKLTVSYRLEDTEYTYDISR